MLFISGIELTVEKILCMELRVRLQRHTKIFRYIKAYGEKTFKAYFNIIAQSVMKLTCHLDIQKHVSYEKLFKYYIFLVYRFIQKFSNALRPIGGDF